MLNSLNKKSFRLIGSEIPVRLEKVKLLLKQNSFGQQFRSYGMKLLIICIAVLSNGLQVNAQSTSNNNKYSATKYLGWGTNSGDLSFRTNDVTRMTLKNTTGRIGIGTTFPDGILHINSSDEAGLSSSGIFTIGTISDKNLVFDKDEIQSRNSNGGSLLYLNRSDGNVWIGNDATATSSTPLIHGNASTGNVGIGSTAASGNRMYISGSPESTDAVLRCKVNYSNSAHSTNLETIAISGISHVENAFGTGIYGEGSWRGIYGYANSSGNAKRVGVYGTAEGSGTGDLMGVYGSAAGSNTGFHIGIYGTATGGSENYGGYFDTKVFANAIRIGDVGNEDETEVAGYKLAVDGKIICEELKVQNSGDWPDYIFSDNYKLMSIDEMEKSIKENKHLPGIPSACEVEENGLLIGDMQSKMMEKIEQLTLYVIELKHQKDELAKRLSKLENN